MDTFTDTRERELSVLNLPCINCWKAETPVRLLCAEGQFRSGHPEHKSAFDRYTSLGIFRTAENSTIRLIR